MSNSQIYTYQFRPVFLGLLLTLGGIMYTSLTHASTTSQAPGTQLAYFIGYHNYYGGHFRPGYMYYGPQYRSRGVYWTGWKYSGYGCQKTCLIDRWSGTAIKCSKRC